MKAKGNGTSIEGGDGEDLEEVYLRKQDGEDLEKQNFTK